MPKKVYAIETPKGKTYITVERFGKNEVALVACDKDGTILPCGYIAIIDNRGISLCTSLNKNANLPIGGDSYQKSHIKVLPTS